MHLVGFIIRKLTSSATPLPEPQMSRVLYFFEIWVFNRKVIPVLRFYFSRQSPTTTCRLNIRTAATAEYRLYADISVISKT
jgi:hypothetical protein